MQMRARQMTFTSRVVLVLLTTVASSGMARAQDPESPPLASELVALLTGAELDAVAARDSAEADRFVAALAFPGQLLVVSARYEVPMYVEAKIGNRDYREVYIDLNSASIPGSKILITDIGADGLSDDDGPDMVDTGSGPARFDGNATVDAQYADMLRSLIAEVR